MHNQKERIVVFVHHIQAEIEVKPCWKKWPLVFCGSMQSDEQGIELQELASLRDVAVISKMLSSNVTWVLFYKHLKYLGKYYYGVNVKGIC